MLRIRVAVAFGLILLAGCAEDTVVAVIDSGVDASHPDLAGQIVRGFDFVDEDGDPNDLTGHGTEMAGIIAANGTVRGVCPSCRIMPLKVAGANGFVEPDRLARAIVHAAGRGADVILVGAGSVGVTPSVLAAVADVSNIPIIAPAGNGDFRQTYYPAALPNVVSVVAVDRENMLLSTANTSGRESVAAVVDETETTALGGGTVVAAGSSSAAAAQVAGVAGLLLHREPDLTAGQVRQVLSTATDPVTMENWYAYFDYGVLNPERALDQASATHVDVAITRLTLFPTAPLEGQAHFVRVRVVNQGNSATGALALKVMSDGVAVGRPVSLSPLDLGAVREVDVELPTGTAPGSAQIVATVQPLPGESEIEDNAATARVTFVDSPVHDVDLVVGTLSEPVIEAGTITVPITVRNRGNQNESEVTVTLAFDGTVVTRQRFDLPVGQERSLQGTLTLDPGVLDGSQAIEVSATLPGSDAVPDDNHWFSNLTVGQRNAAAQLQYSDLLGRDVIIDAPWRSIRDYVPVLIFTPQFRSGENELVHIRRVRVWAYNPQSQAQTLILSDNRLAALDIIPAGVTFLSDVGTTRGSLSTSDPFDNFWHYIIRIPTGLMGAGVFGTHYLRVEVVWAKGIGSRRVRAVHRITRALRVRVTGQKAFPKFDADKDRYYDAHVHTIAEWSNLFAKNYGGPLAMLIESSYAIGLVEKTLNAAAQAQDVNWSDFTDDLVTTDHNIFYSRLPYDRAVTPTYGPTQTTDGARGEWQWYRDNLGRLAGEELHLALEASKLRAPHFLVYDTLHFEGPFHSGIDPNSFTGLLLDRILPSFGLGLGAMNNPWDMETVLNAMRAHNSQNADSDGFGYAAHPRASGFVWPDDHFARAIGLPDDYNLRSGPHVYPVTDPTEFVFKGSQIWNQRRDEEAPRGIAGVTFTRLDPFRPASTGLNPARFQPSTGWVRELEAALEQYYGHVRAGLGYAFQEAEKEKFIRKLYMSAGTDAHGDFNYTDNIAATLLQALSVARIEVNSNAFGRVRTYVLVHDRPDLNSLDATAVEAYREGNTVLTDGPICKFNLDSDGRHNPDLFIPRWHDAVTRWENAEGKIGGLGDFDGGRTALVPRRGQEAETDVWIESAWQRSATVAARDIPHYDMVRQTPSRRAQWTLPAGNAGALVHQPLGQHVDESSAIVMEGRALHRDPSREERCITNPVWAVPVPIDVEHPGICPIPPRNLRVIFHFPVSMSGAIPTVAVQPLDGAGVSSTPFYFLLPDPGWEEEDEVRNGRYTASNAIAIDCPIGDWDADIHAPVPEVKSYVAYMEEPTDLHDNVLNDIGRTFVVRPLLVPDEGCCLRGGGCRLMPPGACTTAGGVPLGPETHCLGDLNDNGVDDACEHLGASLLCRSRAGPAWNQRVRCRNDFRPIP